MAGPVSDAKEGRHGDRTGPDTKVICRFSCVPTDVVARQWTVGLVPRRQKFQSQEDLGRPVGPVRLLWGVWCPESLGPVRLQWGIWCPEPSDQCVSSVVQSKDVLLSNKGTPGTRESSLNSEDEVPRDEGQTNPVVSSGHFNGTFTV